MEQEIGYIWEKLMATVTSMAVSPEPLRKRLRSIWFDQLGRLRSDQFAEEFQDMVPVFVELEEVLRNPNSEAILDSMSDDEVYVFACKITHLYDVACSLYK